MHSLTLALTLAYAHAHVGKMRKKKKEKNSEWTEKQARTRKLFSNLFSSQSSAALPKFPFDHQIPRREDVTSAVGVFSQLFTFFFLSLSLSVFAFISLSYSLISPRLYLYFSSIPRRILLEHVALHVPFSLLAFLFCIFCILIFL